MRKQLLFITAILVLGTTVRANEYQKLNHHHDRVTKRNQNMHPIVFIEGGIKFFISPEGAIDYKIKSKKNRSKHGYYSYQNYRSTPGTYAHVRSNNNRFIQYDYYGRIKRVGTNYISYDRYNRVRRVGSVIVRYNRKGLAHRVGGLFIYYNKHREIRYTEGDIHYTSLVNHKMDRRIENEPTNYRRRH
ncbi:hypothetical protein [Aquimarina pacifica]|uniref:hypothetical protein n=1 Tax=Aquimarina pacifica TaxID=1296415 RepID=UPI00046EAB17|nr:hypothetical protein [Aquimarina pacifica]